MGGRKKATPIAIALRLLYYRDRTRKAMEDKLEAKGLCPEEIACVLKILTEDGLINDERFAKNLLSSRIRNKNWGPRKIFMDLIKKGVPQDIAGRVVSEVDTETITLAAKRAIEKWSLRKGQSLANGLGAKDFKKAYSHLESRGFNGDLIQRILRGSNDTGIE